MNNTAYRPLMTVRTERMRLRIWALIPGSSPKPPTPWSTPQPTADTRRNKGEEKVQETDGKKDEKHQ